MHRSEDCNDLALVGLGDEALHAVAEQGLHQRLGLGAVLVALLDGDDVGVGLGDLALEMLWKWNNQPPFLKGILR